ncbi:MAG: cell division protein FtsA [Candidatus Buchananbacteria bacterium RBG_13_36_9]|uniref:Cell division protein FtsA n=1 Tax=Candidatus Buchananbacteria bacterium RBG_13_36_9 TaxID=1797530 RepID=A0A1G1XRM0_9BACT|nr:MAG: cell division protein FtsA [Candidatus Buchananbacteria bacterium RBG_13_36_9]
MSREDIIVGVDIGSTSIKIAIGQNTVNEAGQKKLHIIGAVEQEAEGINRGVITSIEEAIKSINKAKEKAEKLIGVPLESAWISISGGHITSQISKGVVAVSKTDGEVREEDMERAIEAAKTVTTPPNYEIIHVIPRSFAVDGQSNIKDPVGMTGVRLEVETYIIEGLSSQVKNLTKCIYQTGIDIEDLVLAPLATSEAVLTNRQKELGVAVVNIGGATTSLAVFEQGDLLHTTILPLGSEHITSDIAIGLRTSIDVAEKIKLKYGLATTKGLEKKDEFDLHEFDENEDGLTSRKYLAEIIEARVEEIFDKIDLELKKIDRSGSLPAGIILTGSGVKLPKIIDVCKRKMRLPAALGYPYDIISVIDKVNDLSFTTAIGLVKWGNLINVQRKGFSRFKSVAGVTNKMKKWFKNLMP